MVIQITFVGSNLHIKPRNNSYRRLMMMVLFEISGNQNHYSVIKRLNLSYCTGNFINDIQATFKEIICPLLTCPAKAGMTPVAKCIM